MIANNGMLPKQKRSLTGEEGSKKRRGVKQGVFLFLLSFIVVPLMALLTLALDIDPYLPVGALILFAVGGILRTVYALMFEPGATTTANLDPAALPGTHEGRGSLPHAHSIPASDYASPAGAWRDTNELQHQPGSVTDSTTKLLEKDPPR